MPGIDAWASVKSFRPKDGQDDSPSGPGRNVERTSAVRSAATRIHASTTDPDAQLYRKPKDQPSRLCLMGHPLMENRHGLIVDVRTPMRPAGPNAKWPKR